MTPRMILLAAVVVGGGVYALVLHPLVMEIPRAARIVNETQSRWSALEAMIQTKPALQEELRKSNARLAYIEPSVVVGALTKALQDVKARSKLSYGLKVGAETKVDAYRETALTIEGEASNEGLCRALYELSYAEVPFKVNRIGLAAPGAPDTISFVIEGSTATLIYPGPFKPRGPEDVIFPDRPGYDQFRQVAATKVLGPRTPSAVLGERYVVTGIILDVDKKRRAYVEERVSKRYQLVGAGDSLGPYKVVEVEPFSVLFARGDDRLTVKIGDEALIEHAGAARPGPK